jgi:hypothetical protein
MPKKFKISNYLGLERLSFGNMSGHVQMTGLLGSQI